MTALPERHMAGEVALRDACKGAVLREVGATGDHLEEGPLVFVGAVRESAVLKAARLLPDGDRFEGRRVEHEATERVARRVRQGPHEVKHESQKDLWLTLL